MDSLDTHSFLFFVQTSDVGQRLDKYLHQQFQQHSRAHIQHWIRQGHVFLGQDTMTKPHYALKEGQCFHVIVPPLVSMDLVPEAIPLSILYEDPHILVLDKAAGMVVHPGAGNPDHTLVQALLAHCGDSLSGINGTQKPGLVHRLDKDTSGVMVVAKTDEAHLGLAKQFSERLLHKIYWAFVWGIPVPLSGTWGGCIRRHPYERTKMTLSTTGKEALTEYQLLKTGQGISLLECRPKTGRTHQIRVHCAHSRNPLLSDVLYGGKKHPLIDRHALHAKEISFVHPILKKSFHFNSTLPEDLKTLENLCDSKR